MQNIRNKRTFLISLSLLTVLGLASGVYFYSRYSAASADKAASAARASTPAASGSTSEQVVAKAAKLVTLPSDEKPTVARIKDISKLSGQTFFADADNGDVLIIYAKARQSVIYRESENRIINAGPVALETVSGAVGNQ